MNTSGMTYETDCNRMPQSIRQYYSVGSEMGRLRAVGYFYKDREIIVRHMQGHHRWIWDTDNPGNGRWLQVG